MLQVKIFIHFPICYFFSSLLFSYLFSTPLFSPSSVCLTLCTPPACLLLSFLPLLSRFKGKNLLFSSSHPGYTDNYGLSIELLMSS